MALPRQLPRRSGWISLTLPERWPFHRTLQAPTVETQTYRTLQQVRHETSTWTRHLDQRLIKGVATSRKHITIMIPLKDARDLANGNRRAAWLLFSNPKKRDMQSRCIHPHYGIPPRGTAEVAAVRPTLSLRYLNLRLPLSLYS